METTVQLLHDLEIVYGDNKKQEFLDERPIFDALLPKLMEILRTASFSLERPLAIGSTATVWIVKDVQLSQERALKLPRPRLGRVRDIISIIRTERQRLAQLTHQNLTRIYVANEVSIQFGEEDYSFPYFVMDYLAGVMDLDKYVVKHRLELDGDTIIGFFHGILNGLAYLHKNSIVHCDVKPGNIFIGQGIPPQVADLGYSKPVARIRSGGSDDTEVVHTEKYAHPELRKRVRQSSDSNANVAAIRKDDLRPAYDLFALGRTVQEILVKLQRAEDESQSGYESIFTRYQWRYLDLIAKRLLDGQVIKSEDEDFLPSTIARLPDSMMSEIRYETAEDALFDIEKLLNLYDLEGDIPELNTSTGPYIQIPHCKVPLTPRVEELITHPTFTRLAQVTQLGFVSLLYPGGTHSRMEHVLGTFATCAAYIRALWYDEENCLFKSIMARKDIELGLLAALLHDIAQYPMAHDLTEISDQFSHELFTRQILERRPSATDASLAEIIDGGDWSAKVADLLGILGHPSKHAVKHRFLHSIISGVLDCDKLDYLQRDSTHLGVPFGNAIDRDRLLRNLTLVYDVDDGGQDADKKGRKTASGQALKLAGLGVTEKARIVANSIWKVREEMFTQVYWHHTIRAMKAMLGYVVRRVLRSFGSDEDKEVFWKAFNHSMLSGSYASNFPAVKQRSQPTSEDEPGFLQATPTIVEATSSVLSSSDDAMLAFLDAFADSSARRMISAIRRRALYRRIVVSSHSREPDRYEEIHSHFRTFRSHGYIEEIEAIRQNCERVVVQMVEHKISDNSIAIPRPHSKESLITQLEATDPLVLIDVPIKESSPTPEQSAIWYLPEDYHPVSLAHGSLPRFKEEPATMRGTRFDLEVGKVRVFVHPKWSDLVVRSLDRGEIWKVIQAPSPSQTRSS